jgi:hypothetical protein
MCASWCCPRRFRGRSRPPMTCANSPSGPRSGMPWRSWRSRKNRVIRVIGAPVNQAGQLIEITTDTQGLRAEMIDYGLRCLLISAAFSVLTALLLNIAAQRLLLVPIRRVINHMTAYASRPRGCPRHHHPRCPSGRAERGRDRAGRDAAHRHLGAEAKGAAGAAGSGGGAHQPRPAQYPDHGADLCRPAGRPAPTRPCAAPRPSWSIRSAAR